MPVDLSEPTDRDEDARAPGGRTRFDDDGEVVHRTTAMADVAGWLPDDEQRVDAAVTVPDDLAAGDYRVEVGMRNTVTGDPIVLADGRRERRRLGDARRRRGGRRRR